MWRIVFPVFFPLEFRDCSEMRRYLFKLQQRAILILMSITLSFNVYCASLVATNSLQCSGFGLLSLNGVWLAIPIIAGSLCIFGIWEGGTMMGRLSKISIIVVTVFLLQMFIFYIYGRPMEGCHGYASIILLFDVNKNCKIKNASI